MLVLMNQETAERMHAHHLECGGNEFTKSTLQLDSKTNERYYRYRCVKCGNETRELIETEEQEPRAIAA